MSQPTRREKYYNKNKTAFMEGKIGNDDFERLPTERQKEYCIINLAKKYRKPVRFSCIDCARTALYSNDGYVTDDELIKDTGLRHK